MTHPRRTTVAILVLLACLFLLATSAAYADHFQGLDRLTVFDANGKKVSKVLSLSAGGVGNPWTAGETVLVGADLQPYNPSFRAFRPAPVMPGVGVAFKVKGHPPFLLTVSQDRFSGNAQLLFESTDCSGTPFLSDISGGFGFLLSPVAVASPGHTVYGPDSNGAPQTITVRSVLTDSACVTEWEEYFTDARQALPLIDLDTRFTPPFSVR